MVKTKNNRKSLIALVVMAFMLVASIVMAATGAWFTSSLSEASDEDLNFGNIEIAWDTNNDFSFTTDGHDPLMPGCTLTIAGTVENVGDAAYVGYKMAIVFTKDVGLADVVKDGNELYAAGWRYAEVAGEDGAASTWVLSVSKVAPLAAANAQSGDKSKDLGMSVTIPTTLDDSAEEATASWTVDVLAIQQAHIGGTGEPAVPTTYEDIVTILNGQTPEQAGA